MTLEELKRQAVEAEEEERARLARFKEAQNRRGEQLASTNTSALAIETPSQTSLEAVEPNDGHLPPSVAKKLNVSSVVITDRLETTAGGRVPQRAEMLKPMPRHLVGSHPVSVHSRAGHYMFIDDPERGTIRVLVTPDGELQEVGEVRPFFD